MVFGKQNKKKEKNLPQRPNPLAVPQFDQQEEEVVEELAPEVQAAPAPVATPEKELEQELEEVEGKPLSQRYVYLTDSEAIRQILAGVNDLNVRLARIEQIAASE